MTITRLDAEAMQILALPGECAGYEIFCIVKGSGVYTIDLQQGRINDKQVFVICPGQKRRIAFERCAEGFLFTFPSAVFNSGEPENDLLGQAAFLRILSGSHPIILSDEILTDLREVANMLLKEFHRRQPFRAELLKRYLRIFLLYLHRHFDGRAIPVQTSRESELVQQFLQLLDKHYRAIKMVAAYADELFIGANYLNEIVKKTTGYPASFHIRQRIALEAKRMALYSDDSMKEIAYGLGYSDPCQFSKFFLAATGQNFSAFKKEIRISFLLLPPSHRNGVCL